MEYLHPSVTVLILVFEIVLRTSRRAKFPRIVLTRFSCAPDVVLFSSFSISKPLVLQVIIENTRPRLRLLPLSLRYFFILLSRLFFVIFWLWLWRSGFWRRFCFRLRRRLRRLSRGL